MAELDVALVSIEHPEWEGKAKQIVVKTVEGDMGILPGHEPVLAILAEAPVRIDPVEGDPLFFAVHGGFFSLDSNKVNILADIAEAASEIDVERAKAAKARAEAAGADDADEISAIRRAETRIDVAMKGTAGALRR